MGEVTATPLSAELSSPTCARFSLTGVQLKLSLVKGKSGFTFPANSETGSWIIKLPSQEFPSLPQLESTTMEWARHSGFSVPNCEVISTSEIHGFNLAEFGRPPIAFAVERFDRAGECRIHQEDFAQALDLPPRHKFGISGGRLGVSYGKLALLVRDVCGYEQMMEFQKRLAFIIASGNGDAHLKNWSFQWSERRASLSPLYDQVSTVSLSPFGWQFGKKPGLCFSIGKRKVFAEIDLRALQRHCQQIQCSDAEEHFMSCLELFAQSYAELTAVPRAMHEALLIHWQRTPLLQRVGRLPSPVSLVDEAH